jgi:hypothetical protein
MPSHLWNEKYRRPTIAFQDILRKGSGGMYRERDEYSAFMFRALVFAVDTVGGKLETPTGKPHQRSGDTWVEGGNIHEEIISVPNNEKPVAKYNIIPTTGPVNPPNSIRARIISNNMDQFTRDDDLRCYWPLFPGISNISAGEMAYVIFEDESFVHGLWLARVTTNEPNETANQILRSDTLRRASESKITLYPGGDSSSAGGSGDPLMRDSQYLTKMFMGK